MFLGLGFWFSSIYSKYTTYLYKYVSSSFLINSYQSDWPFLCFLPASPLLGSPLSRSRHSSSQSDLTGPPIASSGLSFTACMSDFSLYVFHPYGAGKQKSAVTGLPPGSGPLGMEKGKQTLVVAQRCILTFLLHYSGRGTVFSYGTKGLSEHQPGVCESQLVQDETQRWPHVHWELHSCQRWQDRHHPHQYLRYERKKGFFFLCLAWNNNEYIQSPWGSVFTCISFCGRSASITYKWKYLRYSVCPWVKENPTWNNFWEKA